MSAQIKALLEAVAKLTANMGNENINPNTNNGNKGNGKRWHPQGQPQPQQLTKICNMGGICHSHGFHPVGANHDSKIALGRQVNKTLTPLGTIAWAVACTGLLPSGLPLNSKSTHYGRESQRPPTDRDQGRQVTKRLNPMVPHSLNNATFSFGLSFPAAMPGQRAQTHRFPGHPPTNNPTRYCQQNHPTMDTANQQAMRPPRRHLIQTGHSCQCY